VLIGRAWVNALAVDGEGGVARVLALMAAEMRVAMALAGVTRIDQITPAILA
jgi:L-lactate dehydrogenase (cytochrome)